MFFLSQNCTPILQVSKSTIAHTLSSSAKVVDRLHTHRIQPIATSHFTQLPPYTMSTTIQNLVHANAISMYSTTIDITADGGMIIENNNLMAWLETAGGGHQEYSEEAFQDLNEYRNGEPSDNSPWKILTCARINAEFTLADTQIKERKDRVRKELNRNYKKLARSVKREEIRRAENKRLQEYREREGGIAAMVGKRASERKHKAIERNRAEDAKIAALKAAIYEFEQKAEAMQAERAKVLIKKEDTDMAASSFLSGIQVYTQSRELVKSTKATTPLTDWSST